MSLYISPETSTEGLSVLGTSFPAKALPHSATLYSDQQIQSATRALTKTAATLHTERGERTVSIA